MKIIGLTIVSLFFISVYAQNNFQSEKDSIYNNVGNEQWKDELNLEKLDSLSVVSVIEISQTNKNYWQAAVGYYLLGNIVSSNKKSIEFLLKAQTALNKTRNDSKISAKIGDLQNKLNLQLSYKYFCIADNNRSIKNAYKILTDSKSSNNLEQIIYANHLIALNHRNLKDYVKALFYLKRVIKISRETNNTKYIVVSLNELANIYYLTGEINQSLQTHFEALAMAENQSDISIKAFIQNDIGSLYMSHYHDYNKALNFFYKSKKLLSLNENLRERIIIDLNIADCLFHLNQSKLAMKLLKKNLELSKKANLNYETMLIYDLLKQLYSKNNNFTKAYYYQEKYIVLKDTLFNHKKVREITEIQSKYETSLREKKLQEFMYKQKIQKQREQKLWIVVSFVFLISFIMFIGLIMRRKKEKQLYAKELAIKEKKKALAELQLEKSKILEQKLIRENQYKSKQLTTHALHMLQKNKLLQETDQELKSFIPKTSAQLRKTLNRIRHQLKKNMNSEKDWQLFKLYFEDVNKDFFKAIQIEYDNITHNDLRIAALIKLNLNIKEAAAVLNISPESLKKARYRLRKKMGLTNRENFSNFLKNID